MAESLRLKVLAAARQLFMERGYDAVGMRDIATAVNKQPVQVYRLKLSKSDILAELIIELNNEQLRRLPKMRKRMTGETPFENTCTYLRELYQLDIKYLPIRSVGAAFGWMWSLDYEQRIVAQVGELIRPLAELMQEAGFDDIPARCFGIWSLYYVGFRHAVIHHGSADECLAAIKPSLSFYLHARQ